MALRAANGAKWTPVASPAMNSAYKQNIELYATKTDQAKTQDSMSMNKFNDQKAELDILTKTP